MREKNLGVGREKTTTTKYHIRNTECKEEKFTHKVKQKVSGVTNLKRMKVAIRGLLKIYSC